MKRMPGKEVGVSFASKQVSRISNFSVCILSVEV